MISQASCLKCSSVQFHPIKIMYSQYQVHNGLTLNIWPLGYSWRIFFTISYIGGVRWPKSSPLSRPSPVTCRFVVELLSAVIDTGGLSFFEVTDRGSNQHCASGIWPRPPYIRGVWPRPFQNGVRVWPRPFQNGVRTTPINTLLGEMTARGDSDEVKVAWFLVETNLKGTIKSKERLKYG